MLVAFRAIALGGRGRAEHLVPASNCEILGQFNFFKNQKIKDFSSESGFCGGKLYPKNKLRQLIKYLERRDVFVYGTEGDPCFVARLNGPSSMQLPANPTVLEVKHELSHYIDFRNLGFESYAKLGRPARELSVLRRLQNNRIWEDLNESEKQVSIEYVDRLIKNVSKPKQ